MMNCKESNYSRCSKCLPPSQAHDLRGGRHCLIAQSMIFW